MINAYELKYGDLVSWVHPATKKKYVFEVKSVDSWDEDQPVRLKMVSKLSRSDAIVVTEDVSFTSENDECWPYLNEAYLTHSGYAPSDVDLSNVLTLDKLQYARGLDASDESNELSSKGGNDNFSTKGKVRSIEDIKPGDRLYDTLNNAVFNVIKVESQRALLEIITQSAQIRATPHIAIEEWFTAPGDTYWVFFDYESACDWYETDRDICAWSIYLDELFVLPESPKAPTIESISLDKRELTLALSNQEEISVKLPKLTLPKPEELRAICDRGVNELLDSIIVQIVEHNAEGKNCLTCGDLNYVELLTIKSKLEESGYRVDLGTGKICW